MDIQDLQAHLVQSVMKALKVRKDKRAAKVNTDGRDLRAYGVVRAFLVLEETPDPRVLDSKETEDLKEMLDHKVLSGRLVSLVKKVNLELLESPEHQVNLGLRVSVAKQEHRDRKVTEVWPEPRELKVNQEIKGSEEHQVILGYLALLGRKDLKGQQVNKGLLESEDRPALLETLASQGNQGFKDHQGSPEILGSLVLKVTWVKQVGLSMQPVSLL